MPRVPSIFKRITPSLHLLSASCNPGVCAVLLDNYRYDVILMFGVDRPLKRNVQLGADVENWELKIKNILVKILGNWKLLKIKAVKIKFQCVN